ncbi:5'-nucleotidase, lipoprotein e(P4) family [Serratia sp. NPDC078593]|uniref:5'-nucleotidase, lipoprotein e(P4) family n=1 Tax=unclassified Serratia (in: enterobacteria) TaxID=2647522 RepID=UPI0037D06A35
MTKTARLSALLIATLPLLSFSSFATEKSTLCAPQKYEMALRFQQQSAEIMALQLQTYNIAQQRFQQLLTTEKFEKKPAIVLDLDETVIDNSPLLVRDIQRCHDYTNWDTWGAWEEKGQPKLIPGAKAFLEHVNQQQVKIFYVSDRFQKNKAHTLTTLKSLGLPQVDENSVLLDSDSKEVRRQNIKKEYQIIMLFGDSLPDFSPAFNSKNAVAEQRKQVAKHQAHLGKDWFVLPNASYGAWSQAKLDAWGK